MFLSNSLIDGLGLRRLCFLYILRSNSSLAQLIFPEKFMSRKMTLMSRKLNFWPSGFCKGAGNMRWWRIPFPSVKNYWMELRVSREFIIHMKVYSLRDQGMVWILIQGLTYSFLFCLCSLIEQMCTYHLHLEEVWRTIEPPHKQASMVEIEIEMLIQDKGILIFQNPPCHVFD